MITGREAALKILYETEQNNGYLNIVFAGFMKNSDLSREERAFAKGLVSGIFQHKLTLDYIIRSYSSVRLKKIAPYILQILRIGLYQIYFMDKVPDSAAVNESVKLAKKYGHKSSGFVNAILRRAISKGEMKLPQRGKDPTEYLSVRYSHPEELTRWYVNTFGEERAESILSKNNEKPPLEARVNTLKTSRDELITILEKEGIKAEKSPICDSALVFDRGINPEKSKAYKDGLFSIQSISSQLAALSLSPSAGETVMDMCSAPGGKTAHLAELMQNEGKIFAFDLYEHRLGRVRENADRLGLTIIDAKEADATEEKNEFLGKADKILLDVPCSGLGIIRRKPDIKYKENLTDFKELVAIQKNILNICSKYLKIEGELVYSTCTVNPSENEEQIKAFLAENPDFELVGIESEHISCEMKSALSGGFMTLYPDKDALDGFFICKMKRRS